MEIERLEVWNLRALKHVDVPLNDYTCFVGPNSAGKSTALCALNIFFRQTDNTGTNLQFLESEDFFGGDTTEPIRIRVTFSNLSDEALETFKHYARAGKLIVTAEAKFDPTSNRAEVRHFGERLGFKEFRIFFEELAGGANAERLKVVYSDLQGRFPDLPNAVSKDAKVSELRKYEEDRPEQCVPIPSEDQFYGVSKGANRLEKYVQWVYVPAVKDAITEQAEAKSSALAKLLSRAVNAKTEFEDELEALRSEARKSYSEILSKNQGALDDISRALNARLHEWADQRPALSLEWQEDESKSIRIEEPWARVKINDGAFEGQVARLGHGLQRSFIIALLQELALFEREDAPRLLLAIEEPELYQHPPQARHLALLLSKLSEGHSQIMVTTHSPYFVSGKVFEDVRLVRKNENHIAEIRYAKANDVAKRIGECLQKAFDPPSAAIARIQQALQPQISEMFFATRLVLVEGREDAAFIQTYLQLKGYWSKFRSLGCHIVPVDGKSELLRPLVIATELAIPTFVMFDCDGDCSAQHKHLHERDNTSIFRALDSGQVPFPVESVIQPNFIAWRHCLSKEVKECVPAAKWEAAQNATAVNFEHGSGLKKNVMHIASFVEKLWDDGERPAPLENLADSLLRFATPTPAETTHTLDLSPFPT